MTPLSWACFAININFILLYFDPRVKYTSYITCIIMQMILLLTCICTILYKLPLNLECDIFMGHTICDFCAVLIYGKTYEKLMYSFHHIATLYTIYFCYTYLSGGICNYYVTMEFICYECLTPLLKGIYVLENTESFKGNYSVTLIRTIMMFIVDKLHIFIRVFCTVYYLYKIFEIKGYFIEIILTNLIGLILSIIWYSSVHKKYNRVREELRTSK